MQYFNAALALAAVVSGAAVSLPPVLYNVTGFSAYCLDFTNTCFYNFFVNPVGPVSGKYKPAQCFIEQGATLAGYLPSVNSVDCTNKELVFNFGLADQRYQMIIASAQGTVGEAAIINIGLPQVVMPAGIQAQYYNGPSSFNLTQIN